MSTTPASKSYILFLKYLIFLFEKEKKDLKLWRGDNLEDVNDCSFQVKSLNLVLCATLISVFLQKRMANWRLIWHFFSRCCEFFPLPSLPGKLMHTLNSWTPWRQLSQQKLPSAKFFPQTHQRSIKADSLAWDLGGTYRVPAPLDLLVDLGEGSTSGGPDPSYLIKVYVKWSQRCSLALTWNLQL